MIQFDKDDKITLSRDELIRLLTECVVIMSNPSETLISIQYRYDKWLREKGLVDNSYIKRQWKELEMSIKKDNE